MKKITSILSVLALMLTAVSCSNDTDELASNEVGYLKLGIETNTTTKENTRAGAPADYDAKKLHVEVKNEAGAIVVQTNDFENDTELNGTQITLAPGKYTVVAHSNNWDGSGSGFNTPYYYGETEVTVKSRTLSTAKITCTQANVKVTVNFSEEFQTSFARATSTIESALAGISAQAFTMGSNKGSAYFPVGNLTATLSVFSKSGEGHSRQDEIKDVQARDHYIINYTVAASGNQGNVTVKVDPSTHTYTYTFEVPRTSGTGLTAYAANAWSTMAFIEGAVTSKKSDFDATKLSLQYKAANAAGWTDVANSALSISGDNVSYKISGLIPETDYIYRLAYDVNGDEEVFSKEVEFATEAQPALYNGSFEEWYEVGNYSSPNKDASTKYWDSSNPGSASFNYVVTFPETSFVHGGSKSAKLAAAYAVIKLAAGSIYTGQFGEVDGTSADLYWGVPFTGRPTALHGFKSYKPGKINRGSQPSGVGAPASGSNDIGIIRVALLTEKLHVDNSNMSTFPNWQTDKRVVAYGVAEYNTSDNDQWVEFNIPLEYHSMTTKPKYILVMGATCKYGDYFYGSDESVLYLDDFELVYGDNPVQQ